MNLIDKDGVPRYAEKGSSVPRHVRGIANGNTPIMVRRIKGPKCGSPEPVVVVNEKAYKPLTPRQGFTLEVEAIVDLVPGAWDDPQDLMRWITSNSYVQSVTLVPK